MLGPRQRPIFIAVTVILVAWMIAIAGYTMAKNSKMTADKVRAYAESVDLSKLSAAARAKAIRELAARMNRLSPDERRKARFERASERWFEQMTEDEKGTFIELTMPTGFKQMLSSFEELPEERRRRAIGDALRRLKEEQEKTRETEGAPGEVTTNAPPVLSKDLQEKITKIGLKTYYSESSAQTKAEMAPLLEELQRMMESGRMFRGGR
jgi:hypothetical protein